MLCLCLMIGAFHGWITHLVNLPVPASEPDAATADSYYFAYGSNMSRRYLYNVRGVWPTRGQPGRIENYEVDFLSPGISLIEPAFAYLVKAEKKSAYGVLYRVSRKDLARVERSEGALYVWRTLPVRLASGQTVEAQTLVRLVPGDTGMPSRRYLQILIEGASEHGLPAAYVSGLKAMPSAYMPVASELMGDLVQAFVMQGSGKCLLMMLC